MKVSIVRGGGVAGFATHSELDSARLDAAEAGRLAEFAGRAGLHPPARQPERRPDELQYEVTVEDETGTRNARYSETSLPEPVRALIGWVDARPETTTRPSAR